VFARADIFVLGKVFSPSELGLYTMAVYLVQTPVSFLMNVLGQTLMPTFAHIHGDRVRERRILVQITSLIVFLGIPVIVFLYFCGHSLIGLVYGKRYTAATGALIAAACVALFNLANGQITTILYARGVPQLHRRAVAIMAAIMITLIYPAAKCCGLVGGQVACLVAVFVGFLFQVSRIRALTGLELGQYFEIFLLSTAMSVCVPAVYLGTRLWTSLASPAVNVGFGIAGCFLAYILTGAVLLGRKGLT
jgi:O-antigen/teichoic acid export membrane protein